MCYNCENCYRKMSVLLNDVLEPVVIFVSSSLCVLQQTLAAPETTSCKMVVNEYRGFQTVTTMKTLQWEC